MQNEEFHNTTFLKFIINIIFFLSSLSCWASHSVGADMYYECIGNSPTNPEEMLYRVYIIDYYLCNWPDSEYRLSLFKSDIFISEAYAEIESVEILGYLDYPCSIIPETNCVKGVTASVELSIPISDSSIFVVYQTCCRQITENVVNGQGVGSTYMIEITPFAQSNCNKNPRFEQLTYPVICVNEDFQFDSSAEDFDGDQIIYEFCSPLLGCDPVTQPCPVFPYGPPPYLSIPYAPFFTQNQPFGFNSEFYIDQATGIISGKPTITGLFSIGICAKEYRNGVLIGEIRRDFQFSVIPCASKLRSSVDLEENDNGHYFINSCEDTNIYIPNASEDTNHIAKHLWFFEIDDQIDTIYNWDAEITFPNGGSYNGLLVIYTDTGCSDTSFIQVNITEDIEANFQYDYDTCVAGPISFVSTSFSDGGEINAFNWDLENAQSSSSEAFLFEYDNPGLFDVTLVIDDINGCKDSISKIIDWRPAPAIIIIVPDEFEGCYPLDVSFDNLTSPIDSTYLINWDFGDGKEGNGILTQTTYTESGVYDISVSITSPIGCYVDTIFKNWINIVTPPDASFSFTKERIDDFQYEVQFTNLSTESDFWFWEFDEFGFSQDENPDFLFSDTGFHEVKLIAFNEKNCMDSVINNIDLEPYFTYFLPNAFTPNNDGLNEYFIGKGKFSDIKYFTMKIWDRYGQLIFQTSNPNEGWNGRLSNVGKFLSSGVFSYHVRIINNKNVNKELTGNVVLIK